MSITGEDTRVVFVGSGDVGSEVDNSPYAIPFPLRVDTSVEVIYVTDADGTEVVKTITTDYTIAVSGAFTTAALTLVTTAPASGETLLIRRDEPATRLSNNKLGDGQPAAVSNSDFDKRTMSEQTLQEQLDRALVVAKGHPDANLPLTPLNLIGNAGLFVAVNAGETDFEILAGSDITGSGTLNTIPLWTPDGSTLGDSVMTQSSTLITVGGTLTVNTDAAGTTVLGRAKIGSTAGNDDVMALAHFDFFTADNFAIEQSDLGHTRVNAPSARSVTLSIADTAELTVEGSLVNIPSNEFRVTLGNVNILAGALEVGGGIITSASGSISFSNENLTTTGTLTVNSDVDGTTILGRAKIGSPAADVMYLSHFDNLNTEDYAIRQTAAGSTSINAKAGATVVTRINDVALVTIGTVDFSTSLGMVTTGTYTAGTDDTVLTTAAGLLRHQAIDPDIAGSGITYTNGELSVTSGLTGSGTENAIPLWGAGGVVLGDSALTQSGSSIVVARNELVVRKTAIGAELASQVHNLDNTDAASTAVFGATVAGASSGDPYSRWRVDGLQTYVLGIDNSEDDKFVGSVGAVLGTTNWLEVTTGGDVLFNGSLRIGNFAAAGANRDDLVISRDQANVGISLLSETDGTTILGFGDDVDNAAAGVTYNVGLGRMLFNINGNQLVMRLQADLSVQVEHDMIVLEDLIVSGDTYWTGENSGLDFAEISAKDNAATMSLDADGPPIQVTIFTTDGESNSAVPSHAQDHITITRAGKYLITCSLSVLNSSGAAHVIDVSAFKNNGITELTNIHSHRTLGTGAEIGSISLSGICDCAAADTIEIWIQTDSSTARTITVDDITLSVVMIGGT